MALEPKTLNPNLQFNLLFIAIYKKSSLWIERNHLVGLPAELHLLSNLNYLHCGLNRIRTIHPKIEKCTNLKGLTPFLFTTHGLFIWAYK